MRAAVSKDVALRTRLCRIAPLAETLLGDEAVRSCIRKRDGAGLVRRVMEAFPMQGRQLFRLVCPEEKGDLTAFFAAWDEELTDFVCLCAVYGAQKVQAMLGKMPVYCGVSALEALLTEAQTKTHQQAYQCHLLYLIGQGLLGEGFREVPTYWALFPPQAGGEQGAAQVKAQLLERLEGGNKDGGCV